MNAVCGPVFTGLAAFSMVSYFLSSESARGTLLELIASTRKVLQSFGVPTG